MALSYSFLVFYQTRGKDTIKLPSEFVNRWGHCLKNPLMMRTSDGLIWEVEYRSTNQGLWLSRGWEDLASELDIRFEDGVMFNYYEGVQFEISLYAMSAMEIGRNRRPPASVPCNFIRPLQKIGSLRMLILPKYFGEIFGESVPNPLTLVAIDQSEWIVHWRTCNGRMLVDQGWSEIVFNFSLTLGDFVFFKYDGTPRMTFNMMSDSHGKIVTTHRRPNWSELPAEVNESTLWTSRISKACVERRQALYIPANVVRLCLSHRPKKIEVVVPLRGKQTWSLIWSKDRKNKCHIGAGWYSFVKAYPIKSGQKVRFYFSSNEEFIRLEVTNAAS